MTFAYGRLTSPELADGPVIETDDTTPPTQPTPQAPKKEENKLVTAIAALVPAEVLALHALVLSATTETSSSGTTSITQPIPLQWSLLLLAATAVVLFWLGHKGAWKRSDTARALIPAGAFVAWTGIIGTSALTPWVGSLSRGWLVLAAGILALLLLGLHGRLNPKT